MTTFFSPGVHMQEVSSGVRPIQAASTSTAAFFGVAERGPIGGVRRVFNFTEFETIFGGFLSGRYLAHAVFHFFNNGGSQCYVGRVARQPTTASVTIADRGSTPQPAMTVVAVSPGKWGNDIQLVVNAKDARDPDNTFDLQVHRSGSGSESVLLESFDGLSMDPASPANAAGVVNGSSAYIRIEPNLGNSNQIAGFLEGTNTAASGAVLGANQRKLKIAMHGDDAHDIDLGDVDANVLEKVRERLQERIRAIVPPRGSTPQDAYTLATVTIVGTGNRKLRITSGQPAADSSVTVRPAADPLQNAAGALGLGLGTRSVTGASSTRPPDTAVGKPYPLGDATVAGAVTAAEPGADGPNPQDEDYKAALSRLDTIRDVSLIAIPGIGSAAVADHGMNYCRNIRELSDCFFIADMASHDDTLEEAERWRNDDLAGPNSYGAVYFPWVLTSDPTGGSAPIAVPPSGFVAGIYARTDTNRGVWKTPAGTQATVAGALGLVTDLTDVQQGLLNRENASVSVIRRFPGTGIVLWGGRTLSNDAEYRYISVRRMAIFLRVSIFAGIQWAVFEPNDEQLWSQLRLNLNSFMMTLFRQGAFQGDTPTKAFFVKVDSETTTQADIDNGVVNVLVGFAALKPAEFVVVKLSQQAGQAG